MIPAIMRSEVLLGRIGVIADVQYVDQVIVVVHCLKQCGITCGAIDEPSRSSKAIDKRVIINFCDKNAITARFCDKNDVFYFFDKIS